MNISIASEKDVDDVMQLEYNLFKKWDAIDPVDKIDENWFNSKQHVRHVNNYIKNDSNRIFLAFEEKKCLGYLKSEIREREPFLQKVGYIAEVFIVPQSRGKQIGTQLLDKAQEWFRQNKITWSTVSSHTLDNEAIAFWEKKGYEDFNRFFKMHL